MESVSGKLSVFDIAKKSENFTEIVKEYINLLWLVVPFYSAAIGISYTEYSIARFKESQFHQTQ
jgi:hypothetical protein